VSKISTVWRIPLILMLILAGLGASPAYAEKANTAANLLQTMTAEEKVGQLFLVTFDGMDVSEESEIYDLIANQHIGGVVLLAENNNFTSQDTVIQAQDMIRSLQEIEWENSSGEMDVEDINGRVSGSFIPLFVGLTQNGNGFPSDQILSGLTPLPSQMAIGATWDPGLASQVGEVLGRELNFLGVNLFLGPNLDVLEMENSEATTSLGVSTYGGDPFWVGEMGKSFISGLHTSSDDRILVVAPNFPGTGNSDRPPESEVATVRKSLEQLKQIELAPFFAVTDLNIDDPGRVDAVMLSHIRYEGFQGNIRATTKPISFDSTAFQQLMALPELDIWRKSGGLVVSDNLGSASVQRFFDPNETNFDAKQVARSAFLAGNDILYLDDFVATGDPDAYTTLTDTLDFFVQKYREDAAFAQRVDSSVMRILSAKLNLYGEFSIDVVSQPVEAIDQIGQSQDVTFSVAQNAVTLINPNAQELDTILPSAPLRYENMVIFTDIRRVRQCTTCPLGSDINTTGLANALIRIYGPQASNQILQQSITSYSFLHLSDLLDNVDDETTNVLSDNLQAADWVIFNTMDIDPNYPESKVLQQVLDERPDLLAGKNVIVFALGSPTYLDATNISKITAYYGLYSKVSPFLDVAARVLMKEIDPPGSLPVSLKAVGYDLNTIISPNPAQVIGLDLVLPEIDQEQELEETEVVTDTPEPITMPSFQIGDTLTIQTTPILDHNNHIVPDGTVVRFNFRLSGDPGITQQFETTTSAGIAFFNYRIETAGGLEITATSEPARQSETLQINISPEGLTSVIQISPTPLITLTPTMTPTVDPTPSPTPTSTPEPVVKNYPSIGEWALGVIILIFGSGIAFFIGYLWWGSSRWGLRSAMCALIGGLLFYTYLNLGFDSTKFWMSESGGLFVVEMVSVGLLMGWIGALVWWMRTDGRYPSRTRR
jgi:beta-N-acetylhexosaminidase